MRKESSNQFTEGLVCDLNPINTPNTVLTDALNATIITYDGNEYSLQNDRGNYPLENCKLKPNYIPVGLKEYGDILYIVSYNPLDNSVEIGTYPSPVEVVGNDNKRPELEIESVIGKITKTTDYSKLVEDCETKIWTSDNEEDTKLYPGDEYKMDEEIESEYKYESLEYFIIDENRKKYDISDLVEKDGEWHPVAWQVPGWLAAQYRIATFDDFIMSVRSMTIPKLGEGSVSGDLRLNFQLRISDSLFLPKPDNDVKSDLYIGIKFGERTKDKFDELISLKDAKFIDWYEDSKILWIDWTKHLEGLSFGDTITFHATPIVKVAGKEITYDSFTESHSIYLNSIGSYSDFNIGNEIWKFYIDEDNVSELYLEYNITGPNVTKTDVMLYYRVFDLNGKLLNEWKPVNSYTGITNQGVGILSFDGDFEKESIYVIEFAFYKPLEKNYSELNKITTIKKLVVASQIFSDFVGEYNNFNEIGFDDWIVKYKDSIKALNWEGSYIRKGSKTIADNFAISGGKLTINEKSFDSEDLNDMWSTNKNEFKGIFSISEANNILKRKESFIRGEKDDNVEINISHKTIALEGPLWDGTPEISVEISSTLGSEKTETYNRNKLNIEKTINESITAVFGETVSAEYLKIQDCKVIKGIEKLDSVPIIHLHACTRDNYANQTVQATVYDWGSWPNNIAQKPTKHVYMEDGGNFVTKNNTISTEIKNLLGDNQMAMLILTTRFGGGAGNYRLYHGATCEWSTGEYKTYGFLYLVFRKTDTDNGKVVVVPIKDDRKKYWHMKVDDGHIDGVNRTLLDAEYNMLTWAKQYLDQFCDNVMICSSTNAVETANCLNIQLGNNTKLPVCDIKIQTPTFNTWMLNGYNLLNYNTRDSIVQRFGEKVCGKLLTGSIATIQSRLFYEKTLENKEDSEYNFNDLINHVNIINSLIHVPDEEGVLGRLNSGNTKGVYYTGYNAPSELIDLLHNNYRSSNNLKLSADGRLENAHVYLTDDKDGIVFANVNTTVTANFNG